MGFSQEFLHSIKELLGVEFTTLAHMLSVTERSLYIKKDKEAFSPAISERLLAVADLYAYAERLLGDREYVAEWMVTPNRALGDKPVMLLNTIQGMNAVREELKILDTGSF